MILKRVVSSSKGTFGVLLQDGFPLCVTCEDPWNNNERGKSCIPEGKYKVVRHSGEKYKNVWRLENVPNRDAILIHQGNTITDTQGCILVGGAFGMFGNTPGVKDSKKTLDYLKAILPDEFELTVTS